jgi:hypothetical protein
LSANVDVLQVLYHEYFERGLRYFLPSARVENLGETEDSSSLELVANVNGTLDLAWLARKYRLQNPRGAFTESEMRITAAIANVMAARYRSFFHHTAGAVQALFRGYPEDRFISAFLDPFAYAGDGDSPAANDYIADAIEVLRESSLLTFENRRISTGVLLFGAGPQHRPDICHKPAATSPEAIPYTSQLTSIKSFHRLCDGIQTLFLVNREGLLVDLVDIRDWTCMFNEADLPAPTPSRYRPHCLATMQGGHICMVLTPNGEIKVMEHGVQVFNFLGGRWRVTDVTPKFDVWRENVGSRALAERLMTAALNLAEARRGALFVVLDDAEQASHFVPISELLLGAPQAPRADEHDVGTKDQIHYLLRHRQVLDLAPALLETIAGVDGSLVMDRDSNLLAFGAILRYSQLGAADDQIMEGGRTTAAIGASRFGNVLKVSEDGLVSYYQAGSLIWEI